MNPIYDKNERTVGWLAENVIYDIDDTPRAFIGNGAVFNYEGDYIGMPNSGFFRDKTGDAVAFMEGASGGPLLPVLEVAPVPPVPAIPPVPPIPPTPPVPPVPSLSWSNLGWEEFLKGGV